MRVGIHVRPASSTTRVGGEHGGALVVAVVEPADRGRATRAALRALARALAVPPGAVTLVRGTTSRQKLIEIAVVGPEADRVESSLRDLLGPTSG